MRLKITYLIIICLVVAFNAIAQEACVIVMSESGEKLHGADIRINFNSSIYEQEGKYCFDFDNAKDTLELSVSYLGFRDTTIFIAKNSHSEFEIKLTPEANVLENILVTATRYNKDRKSIPGMTDVVSMDRIESMPVNNVDDILRCVSNVYVNRSWGIFSKNASVTMRGLESSSRTLILLDGIPLNKAAGGSINWHMINESDIKKIEIIKGPVSAFYGANAMGGVINIITKKTEERFKGSFETFYGSYNTFGNSLSMRSSYNSGLYWSFSEFYRQGDGYVLDPESMRDTTSAKAHLKEGGANILLGYRTKKNGKVEISSNYYSDIRGEGKSVYEPDGSYFQNNDILTTFLFDKRLKKGDFSIKAYRSGSDYFRQNESLNNYGEYKLMETSSQKVDCGFMANLVLKHWKNNILVSGLDVKDGDVFSRDIYFSSSDDLSYKGNLLVGGVYVHDEFSFGKFTAMAGLRFDHAYYYNGSLTILNPTKNTGFSESSFEEFATNGWSSLSPKLSLQYSVSDKTQVYISAAKGFNPPKLDDLSKSGKINKGFKIANPYLGPETLYTYELGTMKEYRDMNFTAATYFTTGKDFQYFVSTGDYVDTGADNLKPVFKRQNIGEVNIIGCEADFSVKLHKNLLLKANYAYNHSIIKSFDVQDTITEDLTGKFLMEVSPHTGFAGVFFTSKYADVSVTWQYIGEQWADDVNIVMIENYDLLNARISHKFKIKKSVLNLYIDVQNIMDEPYIDRKGMLSPGRFIVGGIKIML